MSNQEIILPGTAGANNGVNVATLSLIDLDDAVKPETEIIEDAFKNFDSDAGVFYKNEVIEALACIYEDKDKSKWGRIYHRLRKYRIATEVKKTVIVFLRKSYFEKSSISSTSNTGKGFNDINPALNQHPTNTKPDIKYNSLVTLSEETGNLMLIIESFAAKKLKEVLYGFLSYEIFSQTWHEFTSVYWKPLESSQLPDQILLDLLHHGAGELGFKPCYKNGIKSLLADGNMLPLPEVNHSKLPFSNGLLNLESNQLEPIAPDNAQTWCLPYKYQPNADCPAIKAWLLQTVDEDSQSVEFLRAWMAAVLHGRSDLQKFLHLIGSGGTGKGAFMRLLTVLVGERNTAMTSLEQLEQNRFETAALYNKRLAVISESDKYGGSINTLKAITGQDHIRLERKHQQQAGSFVFQGLVVMASNESLQVTDHTSALDRRRITVIFDRRATDEEKQSWEAQGGEKAVLHSELPGLVNWLLELSSEDISQIIRNPPERITNANLHAMTASNPLADWITECCIQDNAAWTQIGDKREIREQGQETAYENADKWLYSNYLQRSQRAHKTPLAIRRFKDLLLQTCTTLGISAHESRRSNGTGINGIRIRLEHEPRYGDKPETCRI